MAKFAVPVGVSNRHLHLSQADLERLFGAGYQLTVKKDLSQKGQYAAEETVTLIGPKGSIPKVRVLGPVRKATQIEISATDSYALGIAAPVRDSGDVAGSPGIKIEGPKGVIEIPEGVIIAKRHVHLSPEDAERLGVKDKDIVKVEVGGERALVFGEVLARVHETFVYELHIDTDEANAAGLRNGDTAYIITG